MPRQALLRTRNMQKTSRLSSQIHGQPIAALLSVPNADVETVSLSTKPEFISLILRSRERQQNEGGFPARRCDVGSPDRDILQPA